MNKSFFILTLIILTSLFSCKKEKLFQGETTDFGTIEYYDSFLFYECENFTLSKTLKYNFNDYSIDKKSTVKLNIVDAEQNVITNRDILFYVNDELVKGNSFTIDSKVSSKGSLKLGLKFLPSYPNGYTSGFISVSSHSLDVINNNDLNTSSEKRLFKWESTHKLIMNPLKKWLMWFVVFIISSLLMWFLIIRNKVYSKFKKGKIQIVTPYFKGINITRNTRLIVFTNVTTKQKVFNRVFTGKIIYEVNPIYENKIILRPGRGNRIKIKLPLGVKITPQVVNLEKFNNYNIKLGQESLEIQYS
ncbi:hypothetical protein [Algibacter sp. L3A6]|uniref:hypothetical protein n=1 Tax=Algibacter sp. L3A6 TaxID=2686366 RepID=UPI00131A958E|nr:hypothetical protein [Algibacter sp. L3A6]